MKKSVSMAWVKEHMPHVVRCGYCELQDLFRGQEAAYYNAGAYGWNCDVYTLGSVTVTTGYRNTKGTALPHAFCEGYNYAAALIWDDPDIPQDVKYSLIDGIKEQFQADAIAICAGKYGKPLPPLYQVVTDEGVTMETDNYDKAVKEMYRYGEGEIVIAGTNDAIPFERVRRMSTWVVVGDNRTGEEWETAFLDYSAAWKYASARAGRMCKEDKRHSYMEVRYYVDCFNYDYDTVF